MRTILFALVAVLAPAVALAQQAPKAGPFQAQPQFKPPGKKAEPQRPVQACPEYGAGFVKVEGTGACVKIGGYVRHESSWSR